MDNCVVCGFRASVARHTYKGYDLVSCESCGLNWVQPIPAPEVLAEYYSTTYRLAAQDNQADLSQSARDANLIQEWLTEYAPSAQTVCEVGCARGHLLHELCRRGYKVKGYELSSVTSAFAREKLGIDVTTGEVTADGPGFDVILMRHVLEHTPDPIRQIRALAERLRPEGLLILAVPNGAGLAFRMLGEYWTWYVPPAHLWYFTARSLKRLLSDNGLELLLQETRRGDANNLILELGLGAARWIRAAVSGVTVAPGLVPQRPEDLGRSGWSRRSLNNLTNLLYFPFGVALHYAGLGDELWLVARKTCLLAN